jgi:membrane protease YdiL (CAAX protease family)
MDEAKPPRPFGAKVALVALGANALVQMALAFLLVSVVGRLGGTDSAVGGAKVDRHAIAFQTVNELLLPLSLLTLLPGLYVTYRIVKPCFPGPLLAGALESLGWKSCSARALWISALAGFLTPLVSAIIIALFFSTEGHKNTGPLMHLATGSRWGMLQVGILAMFIAPPIEEFLFRGVLYTGLAKSWGKAAGAVATTALFVLAHVGEAKGFLPGLTGVAVVAAGAVYARERTGSLSAPVALHTAYNWTLFVAAHLAAAK